MHKKQWIMTPKQQCFNDANKSLSAIFNALTKLSDFIISMAISASLLGLFFNPRCLESYIASGAYEQNEW